jgi:hypothetical protein
LTLDFLSWVALLSSSLVKVRRNITSPVSVCLWVWRIQFTGRKICFSYTEHFEGTYKSRAVNHVFVSNKEVSLSIIYYLSREFLFFFFKKKKESLGWRSKRKRDLIRKKGVHFSFWSSCLWFLVLLW